MTWVPAGFPVELEDGDRFELTVTDSKGRKVLSVGRTATYQEHYPNGKRCDVYPCKRTEFDIE